MIAPTVLRGCHEGDKLTGRQPIWSLGRGERIKSTEDDLCSVPVKVGLLPVLESCSPYSLPDARPSHEAPPAFPCPLLRDGHYRDVHGAAFLLTM